MEEETAIPIRQALRVFQKVCDEGEKQGDSYVLNGLTASTDFDGYTVYLSSADVTLTIYFHNKYDVQCKNRLALQNFVALINKLDKSA